MRGKHVVGQLAGEFRQVVELGGVGDTTTAVVERSSTTPLGWVRRMRLQCAPQQFLGASDEANVIRVAVANGFGQLGRFAAQYRRQFGGEPSSEADHRR